MPVWSYSTSWCDSDHLSARCWVVIHIKSHLCKKDIGSVTKILHSKCIIIHFFILMIFKRGRNKQNSREVGANYFVLTFLQFFCSSISFFNRQKFWCKKGLSFLFYETQIGLLNMPFYLFMFLWKNYGRPIKELFWKYVTKTKTNLFYCLVRKRAVKPDFRTFLFLYCHSMIQKEIKDHNR